MLFEPLDKSSYLQRFEYHCRAHRIPDDQQLSSLYVVIGSNTCEVLKNTCLPEPLHKLSYTQVKEKLGEIFDCKRCQIVERYWFHLIRQLEHEDIQRCVDQLKRQVVKCDNGEYANIVLRDQFVLGIWDDNIHKRLLSEVKLTFERVVDITLINEQVNCDVASIKTHTQEKQKNSFEVVHKTSPDYDYNSNIII